MRFVTVNGARIHYTDSAPAAGGAVETIVFSHGLFMDVRIFKYQVAEFTKKGYRCVCYEHRGQGKSNVVGIDAKYDIETLYQDALAFIKSLNVGPVHFVGHSMGTYVAMRLAIRNPDLLRSLTVISGDPDAGTLKLSTRFVCFLVGIFGTGWISGILERALFGPSFIADATRSTDVDMWRTHIAGLGKGAAPVARGIAARDSVRALLPQIKAPSLVIAGTEDKKVGPSVAAEISAGIPNARSVSINNAGHASQFEQCSAVNAAMSDFFKAVQSGVRL
eukprot:Opistho-2@28583